MQKMLPFLMFQSGEAEEAVRFYASVIQPSEVVGQSPHGTWELRLKGVSLMAFDSPVKHEFGFTPAVSLFLRCDTAEEVDRLAGQLSQGGSFLMPLDAYPFSERFCWVNAKYGVSWQLALTREET